MLTDAWINCLFSKKTKIAGQKFGIAYTASFFGDPKQIWYDRLSTDVPRFVAEALRKLDADSILLSIEEVTSLCDEPKKVDTLSGIFNVCLGHKSLDNWTLVPSVASWCQIPIFPNGAHATILGEDKITSGLYAKYSGLQTAGDWLNENGWVQKPRGLGSSEGLEFHTNLPPKRKNCFEEHFVPGADLTTTFLYNPESNKVECIGGLLVLHQKSMGYEAMWTKDKKSQGTAKQKIKNKKFVQISPNLEQHCITLAEKMCIRSAFRIDFRCPSLELKTNYELEDVYFLEINPTPTLSAEGSFGLTMKEALRIHNKHTGKVIWDTDDYEAFAIASMIVSMPNKSTSRC